MCITIPKVNVDCCTYGSFVHRGCLRFEYVVFIIVVSSFFTRIFTNPSKQQGSVTPNNLSETPNCTCCFTNEIINRSCSALCKILVVQRQQNISPQRGNPRCCETQAVKKQRQKFKEHKQCISFQKATSINQSKLQAECLSTSQFICDFEFFCSSSKF